MAERSKAVEEQAVRDGAAAYSMEAEITTSKDVPPGYKRTEVGVIPEDWEVRALRDLSLMKSGESITSAKINDSSPYPCYGGNGLRGFTSRYTHDGDHVLIGRQGALCGNVVRAAGQFYASEHAVVTTAKRDCDTDWLSYVLDRMQLNRLSESSAQPGLSVQKVLSLQAATPSSLKEQRAIATALSDADALIESLDRLIAKKRAIKQAAMQQLLTGQARLPGFTGEWETKPFGQVLERRNLKSHQIQTVDYRASGNYPVVDQGQEAVIGFTDRHDKVFSCPKTGVIVFGDHTCIIKFVDFDFAVGADGTQVLEAKPGQCTRFYGYQLEYDGVQPTGYNRHFKFLKEKIFPVPEKEEQNAIATVLSDMDTEIEALERRRDKARQIKQGMMQQLLTGRVRLVTPGVAV